MITLSTLLNVIAYDEVIYIDLLKTDGTFEHVYTGRKGNMPKIGDDGYFEKYAPLKVMAVEVGWEGSSLDILLEEEADFNPEMAWKAEKYERIVEK